jgi:antitoxin ParD1/3/4
MIPLSCLCWRWDTGGSECHRCLHTKKSVLHFKALYYGVDEMKPAGQMTLTLTGELEQFVRDEVKRGAFATSSEYVRDLVRERYMKQKQRVAREQALDAALLRGIADADAGRSVPLDEAFAKLRKELDVAS